MKFLTLTTLLLSYGLSTASALGNAVKGFNYGSTFDNGTALQQSDFEAYFLNAQHLIGTDPSRNYTFNSARLYTMIQANGEAPNTPISAIPAAIATNTSLLLGMWASAGRSAFQYELQALQNAITQYGQEFIDRIIGISVGSEDLYRITPTGIENKSGVGEDPAVIAEYITTVKNELASNNLSQVLVGHVDTWTAWVNNSNNAVIEVSDFIGMDGYPYYQVTLDNSIQNGPDEFWQSYNQTVSAVRAAGSNSSVWVTETGWPVSGPQQNAAIASPANAEYYWNHVACGLLGNINTWWFTMQDADPNTPSPSFGIIPGPYLTEQPLYNITCAFVQ